MDIRNGMAACFGCQQPCHVTVLRQHLVTCPQFAAYPPKLQQLVTARFEYAEKVMELSKLNKTYQDMVANNEYDRTLCRTCATPEDHPGNISCWVRSARMEYKEKAAVLGNEALNLFSILQDLEYTSKLEEIDERLTQKLAGYPAMTEAEIAGWVARGFKKYIKEPIGDQIHAIVLSFNEKQRAVTDREKELKKTQEFIRYKMSGAVDPDFEAQFLMV